MITYGVLKGRLAAVHRAEAVEAGVRNGPGPNNYKSNHFHIMVQAGGKTWRCPVNVKSADGSEVWIKTEDALVGHPILKELPALPEGLTELPQRRPGRTLDFVREPLFDRFAMRQLPLSAGGANDDVQDQLEAQCRQAQAQPDALVFVFGSFWRNQQFPPDKLLGTNQGVHDVHMNQGNDPAHKGDDGVWQDGGVILHFPSTNRYVGVFLCFQSQVWFTDDTKGHRLPGRAEGPRAGAPLPPVPPPVPPPIPPVPPVPPAGSERVQIIAALVNPAGDDAGKESVVLFNFTTRPVSLEGWKIVDRQNKPELLPRLVAAGGTALTIALSGLGAQLSNKGGTIRLLNSRDEQIDSVSYSASQADSPEFVSFR